MSIKFLEGFANYGANDTNGTTLEARMRQHWDRAAVTFGGYETKIAAGRGGIGQSIYWGAGRDHYMKKFLPNSATWFVGFNYYVPGYISHGDYILDFYRWSDLQFRLATWNDGSIHVYRNSVLVGNSAVNVLRGNSWNHIELKLVCDNSAGSIEVRVNENVVINQSGIDTAAESDGIINQIILRAGYGGSKVADFYIADGAGGQDFMGEHIVETIRPSADTAQADWTPSTGIDNYALVDDDYPDDTDYVSSVTPGDKDLYDFGSLSDIQSGIKAVQVSTLAMVSAATSQDLIPVVKSGTTEQDGATHRVSGVDALAYHDIYEQDPDTAVDWTTGGINAIQAGVKVG